MKEKYTNMFKKIAFDDINFRIALEIARANAWGNMYVIGGYVFRNVSFALYGGQKFSSDIDIAVDAWKPLVCTPIGWKAETNSYGTPKFVSRDCSVDLPCLAQWHSIVRRGLSPTIENALTGTPLNIQSIVYDINNGQVYGDIGINAIVTRTIAVNDYTQAQYYAERKKKPLNQIIAEKARELNFTPVFSDY
jgi:hypothetical protein